MNDIRAVLSIILFVAATYCLIDLFITGFSLTVLIFVVIGYVFSHYLWPPKRDDESVWYDSLEIIIELPFHILVYTLRGLGKLLRNADSGLDI
jgi:hypothetical protein